MIVVAWKVAAVVVMERNRTVLEPATSARLILGEAITPLRVGELDNKLGYGQLTT